MDSQVTNQLENIKQELAAFRDFHQSLKEIGSNEPRDRKDEVICRHFKKICCAKQTSLFIFNPKTDRFEFKTGVGNETLKFSGGFLEIGHESDPTKEFDLEPKTSVDMRIQTLNGAYELQDKSIMTIPIGVASRTYSIFVCEFERTTPVISGHVPEMIRILKDYLSPYYAYYVETQLLEEKAKSLELLYEIGSILSSIRDENKLLEKILELIEKYIQVDRCSLMIMDRSRKYLTIKKSFGIDKVDIKKIKVQVGVGISGHVAMGKRPLLIKDIASESHLVSQVSKGNSFRTNSLLSVLLVAQGKVIGVINVNNRKDGLPFTLDDMELLSKISSEIAAVLQRSYMALQLKKARVLDQTIKESMI